MGWKLIISVYSLRDLETEHAHAEYIPYEPSENKFAALQQKLNGNLMNCMITMRQIMDYLISECSS